MKALVYREFGQPDVLKWTADWPDPKPDASQVLVRMQAGSINPKDALLRKGKFSRTLARDPLPRISGMDGAGEVVSVGQAVKGFAPGDLVYGMTNHFSGGVHAELVCFESDEIAHAPASISAERAATVPLAALTALQALRDCAALQPGDKLLVNGASGGVGHFAVQIGRIMGATVHGVCSAANADFVNTLGVAAVHDYAVEPAHAIGEEFAVVFDVFGKYRGRDFKRQLGGGGCFVSTVPKPSTIAPEALAVLGISRKSRLVQVRSVGYDLQYLAQLIDAGELRPHLQASYPVERAAEAHRHIESRRTIGKICMNLS